MTMKGTGPVPLVGVTTCTKVLDEHSFHAVGEKYVSAVVEGAGALPLLIPARGADLDLDDLLARLDGLMLTGSPSNVEPHHYGGPPSRPQTPHDAKRDATVLPLVTRAVDACVPVLAMCRGLQELNVAYGGSLHAHLHEVPGKMDHRRDRAAPFPEQYAPRHPIALTPGGQLAALAGALEVEVNSLHGQGVDRVGEGLVVEATAPDGTVEALRVSGAPAFALAVQWHPEWRVLENPFYAAIFAAFGDAARERAARRQRRLIAEKVA